MVRAPWKVQRSVRSRSTSSLCTPISAASLAGRHANGFEVIHCGLNARQGDLLVAAFRDVPNVFGKTDKPLNPVLIHIARPLTPNGGKRRAVGNVKHGRQLVAQLMRRKISCRPVLSARCGTRCRTHDLAHGIVIMGVFHGLGAVGNHRTQKRLGNGIGQLIVQGLK